MQKQSVSTFATISMASRRLLTAGSFDKARHRRAPGANASDDGGSSIPGVSGAAQPDRGDVKIVVTGDACEPDQLRHEAGRARAIAENMSEDVRRNLLQIARGMDEEADAIDAVRKAPCDPEAGYSEGPSRPKAQ